MKFNFRLCPTFFRPCDHVGMSTCWGWDVGVGVGISGQSVISKTNLVSASHYRISSLTNMSIFFVIFDRFHTNLFFFLLHLYNFRLLTGIPTDPSNSCDCLITSNINEVSTTSRQSNKCFLKNFLCDFNTEIFIFSFSFISDLVYVFNSLVIM